MAKFTNPVNGYKRTDGGVLTWLWCLIFGPFYFASRGNWGWVFFGLFLGMITCGISWLLFPFFVYKINRTQLYDKGFVRVD